MSWVRRLLGEIGLVGHRDQLQHFDQRIRSSELTALRQERAIASLERRAELVARRIGKTEPSAGA